MEIISKITMKVVMGGDVKPLLFKANPGITDIKEAKPMDLALIYGWAHGVEQKPKDTAYGPNIYISGEFKAKNLLTGNVYYATQLYAPGVLHDLIAAKLKNVEPPIEFAFIVGVKYSSTSGKEYEYTIRSMVEPKMDNNPFAKLEQQINNPGVPPLADTAKPVGSVGSSSADVVKDQPVNPDGTINPEDIAWQE